MKHGVLVLLLGAIVTVQTHFAAAQALAAANPTALINLCTPEQAARSSPQRGGSQPPASQPVAEPRPATPDRSRWARDPLKVFDNLYYVGEREYSAWALTTSAGIVSSIPFLITQWKSRSWVA